VVQICCCVQCAVARQRCAVARQRPLPWQPHHGGRVRGMMGCNHASCVPVGLLVGDSISNTFPTWRRSAILNFKNFNIWSHDCHCGPILLLHTKFHQNWFTRSASRPPWLQNIKCAVSRQRPLPWQPHHAGHVGHMMGCDHPSCVPVGPL